MIHSLSAGLARRIVLITAVGLLVALLVALTGAILERQRFGGSLDASFAKIENEVRLTFEASASTLASISAKVVAAKEDIAAASRDTAAARNLFDRLDQSIPEDLTSTTGVTVYDARLSPVAWGSEPLRRVSSVCARYTSDNRSRADERTARLAPRAPTRSRP